MFSAGIGMSVAVTSLVAPALGARDLVRARRLSTHAAVFTAGAITLIVAVLWPALPLLLGWLGASGRSLTLAGDYLLIVLPSLPPLAIGLATALVVIAVGSCGPTARFPPPPGSDPASGFPLGRFAKEIDDPVSGRVRLVWAFEPDGRYAEIPFQHVDHRQHAPAGAEQVDRIGALVPRLGPNLLM